jgi:son of sevenless-like protein
VSVLPVPKHSVLKLDPGVFLSTLQFIVDGNPDVLPPNNLMNFFKRQKASEVMDDIKRWQATQYNLTPVPIILNFIEDSLNQFNNADTRASADIFWKLSLEREPREREDEKMARLLQESGFL